jgi:hypothetical protein
MIRRILVLLSVVALMVVMLAMTASSAMAYTLPSPPVQGEPLLSGNPDTTTVVHCGPAFELLFGIEGVHGAGAFNNNQELLGGGCVLP